MNGLIKDQTIRMDAHVSGKEPKLMDLHIHKKVNKKNRKIVQVKIPVNINREISIKGDVSELCDEMKKVFKKDERKTRKFASGVIETILKYDEFNNLTKEEQRKKLEEFAQRLAEYFEAQEIADVMSSEINGKIQFFLTSHIYNNKMFYIKQDLYRQYIKIGDDLEQIFHGNENSHQPDLFVEDY
jgi:hypothetical protein